MKTTKKINTGTIKLTSKNISEGLLKKTILKSLKNQRVLGDDELLSIRRKLIPDEGTNRSIYIFAYGSLLWNPTFKYELQIAAKIYGYHRSFCMKTRLGRGSVKNPGLMLGLDYGGSCHGSVYKLHKKNEVREIDLLFKREMVTGTYIPKLLKAELLSKKKVDCLTFVINRENENYIPDLSLEEISKIISKAHGFFGSCEEYLNYTITSLSELKIKDKKMNIIQNLIRENKT